MSGKRIITHAPINDFRGSARLGAQIHNPTPLFREASSRHQWSSPMHRPMGLIPPAEGPFKTPSFLHSSTLKRGIPKGNYNGKKRKKSPRPGDNNDPLMVTMSKSQTRWYRWYLSMGVKPEHACDMASRQVEQLPAEEDTSDRAILEGKNSDSPISRHVSDMYQTLVDNGLPHEDACNLARNSFKGLPPPPVSNRTIEEKQSTPSRNKVRCFGMPSQVAQQLAKNCIRASYLPSNEMTASNNGHLTGNEGDYNTSCKESEGGPEGRHDAVQTTECRLVVLAKNMPLEYLTNEELMLLEEAIVDEICQGAIHPINFTGIEFKLGTIVVSCGDEETANWLKTCGPCLKSWKGPVLTVVDEESAPSVYRIMFNLPKAVGQKWERIQTLLKCQNKGINCDVWRVISRINIGKNQLFDVLVESVSRAAIVQAGGVLKYRFGAVGVEGLVHPIRDEKWLTTQQKGPDFEITEPTVGLDVPMSNESSTCLPPQSHAGSTIQTINELQVMTQQDKEGALSLSTVNETVQEIHNDTEMEITTSDLSICHTSEITMEVQQDTEVKSQVPIVEAQKSNETEQVMPIKETRTGTETNSQILEQSLLVLNEIIEETLSGSKAPLVPNQSTLTTDVNEPIQETQSATEINSQLVADKVTVSEENKVDSSDPSPVNLP